MKLKKSIRSVLKRSYESLPDDARNLAREVIPPDFWRSVADFAKSATVVEAGPLVDDQGSDAPTNVSGAGAAPSASGKGHEGVAPTVVEAPEPDKKLRLKPSATYWRAHGFPEACNITLEVKDINQDLDAADFLIALESLNGRPAAGKVDEAFQPGSGWHYSTSLRTYYQYLPALKKGTSYALHPLNLDEPVSSLAFSLRQWSRSDVSATAVCEILALHIIPLNTSVEVTVLPSAEA